MYHRADFIQKRSGAVSPSLYAETGYRSQRFADGDYEFWQSQTDLEESGRIARANGRFALSVCTVPSVGETISHQGATGSFYRMLSHADFYGYFQRLYIAYTQFESLEEALNTYPGIPMEKLCAFLEVSAKSPQKKLNMFLRWMIRRDSEVDFGIWESFDRKDLIVPLDTHVCRVAYLLQFDGFGNFFF